ncbi:MAG: hypothetical protein RSC36_06635 [Ruthenibacterium sp.]
MTNQIVYCVALLLQGAVFAAFVTVSLTPRWRASVCFALYLAGEMISVVVTFFFGFPFAVGMLIETVMFALQTFALFKDSNAKKLIVICELLMVAFLADLFLTSLCSALFGISIEDFSKSYALRAYGSLAGTFILAAGYAGIYSVTHRKKALLQNTTLRRFILLRPWSKARTRTA